MFALRRRTTVAAAISALSAVSALSMATSGPATADQSSLVSPVQAAMVSHGTVPLSWSILTTGSTQDFRGVDAVSRSVVWAAGTNGAVLLTVDAGSTWKDVSPPQARNVYFRDIEATSARHAVLMSVSGVENEPSGRVWVTDDGGATWSSPLATTDTRSFFDCLAFSSPDDGYLVGDPVDGRFEFYLTHDAGHHWRKADRAGMPIAVDGQFAFAAGGACMSAIGHSVWFGTGGTASQIYRSTDSGHTFTAVPTTIISGDSAGIFAAQFRDDQHGIALGGDIDNLTSAAHNTAISTDSGRTWREPKSYPAGLRTAAAWVAPFPAAIAVGPTGSEISLDDGHSWRPIDTNPWNTVSCSRDLACYAVGNSGLVARLKVS
jgi:photosystem II stability/assembly factor-like uncharacterized protein